MHTVNSLEPTRLPPLKQIDIDELVKLDLEVDDRLQILLTIHLDRASLEFIDYESC